MGIYERQRHLVAAGGVWGDPFLPDADAVVVPVAAVATPVNAVVRPVDVAFEADVKFGNHLVLAQDDAVPVDEAPSSDSFGHDDATRPRDKIQRRLAQNREAARKSRLRKKAYIQNLETSRMKLAQLEQELTMARRQQQGAHAGGGGLLALPVDPRVTAFELEYGRWVEDQKKQAAELRAALQSEASEFHLRFLVDAGLAHYDALFDAKSRAARSDAFFVLSGVWRAPAERFFLWIGGFRPSELLKVLAPQLDPLTEQQASSVRALQNTARQLEDALSQGMNKLQQTLVDALLTVDSPDDAAAAGAGGGGYAARQMASAVGKLDDLVSFVDQADHLRQQTLRNMNKILTLPQAARGLLALAEYCQRLRALSSLWAARPREPA
ncbi:Transcription factor TGA1 [Dichanthelium oligosanthes]|uniref:Transcription factor TGA1 n=1 Tax=Dichanthelium oligosanthes TaxID=888268 RepID=A0A1E5WJS2_9POAL|nr:Transcription factor TGA1 [Dichanthelium oligosanthes]